MTIDELRSLARDCYAAFNQAMPEASSRAWTLWAEMCAEVPLRAAPFIRDRILQLDSLPRNFGKAVSGYGEEWMFSNGGIDAAPNCPDCDPATPGFFPAWREDGRGGHIRFMVKCRCNRGGRAFRKMWRGSREDAAKRGWITMPPGMSAVAFEMTLAGWPAPDAQNSADVPPPPASSAAAFRETDPDTPAYWDFDPDAAAVAHSGRGAERMGKRDYLRAASIRKFRKRSRHIGALADAES